MHWNPQPFAQAHESLLALADNPSVAAVKSVLEPISGDLHELLATPPKSATSRSKLGQKSVELENDVIELNDAFINDAAAIADELNVDELVAAKLAFYAIEDSRRLEISIVESGITLFYLRRQYIIDIVRFAVETLPVSQLHLAIAPTQGVDRILQALKTVENQLNGLSDRAKTGAFMGINIDELLKLQHSFLVSEHEALGNLLVAFLDADKAASSPSSARALLEHVATFEVFDSRFVPYANALIVWLTRPQSTEFGQQLWTYFETSKAQWKLPFWFAAVELVFCIGLDDACLAQMPRVSFDDVLETVRRSIDEGALEFWMSYAQDISAELGGFGFDKYRPLVRSRVPNFVAWQPELDALTISNFQAAMFTLVLSFVSEFADILKEMRLSEEDMYLAINELEDEGHTISPGVDLERFFLLASAVFYNNARDSARVFDENSDEGDVLHGFLVWGSSCRATLMAATFAELVGSLANDSFTSNAIYDFLLNSEKSPNLLTDGAPASDCNAGPATCKSDHFVLSWPSIVDVFDFYTHPDSKTYKEEALSPASSRPSASSNFVMPQVVAPVPTASLQAPLQAQTVLPTYDRNAERTLAERTLAERTLAERTLAERTLAERTLAERTLAERTLAERTLAERTLAERALPERNFDRSDASTHYSKPYELLSDDTLLVLSAYMKLISRVASQSTRARDYFQGKPTEGRTADRSFAGPTEQLLRMGQPISGAIFGGLTPFASPDMWRTLDAVVLGKFDETLTSLEDALAFLGLLAELVKQDPLSPKFGEYVDFVFKTILPWTTSPDAVATNRGNSASILETQNVRVAVQAKCLQIAQTLLSKSAESAKSSPSEPHSASAESPLRSALVPVHGYSHGHLHHDHFSLPVLKMFFDSKVHEPLFEILCTGLDAIVSLDSSHPLVKAITLDVEVMLQLLQLSKPPQLAFDKQILYHLQLIPHIALYAGSRHTQLSLACIALLSELDKSPEFRATTSRQSRILSILSSTSEATRIRVGLMTRMGDPQTSAAVKIALLETLARELAESGVPAPHMSVAHYLLGFRQSELGLDLKLELDTGVGGIQSGSSLLMVICDTLLQLLASAANHKLLRLCTVVLSHVCLDSLTSDMVLDYMRKFNFWMNTMKLEPVAVADDDVLEHRALLLEIWDREIKLCQRRLLLTIEGHYIEALVPAVFDLVDLSQIRESPVALRSLTAWCELIPVLLVGDKQLSAQMDGPFVALVIQKLVACLPQYSRQNADFAEPIANLLVVLFQKFEERGVDNVVARDAYSLFQSALECMQPAQMNSQLRGNLYTLCCQCLRLSLIVGNTATEQGTLDILIDCGPEIFHLSGDDIINRTSEELQSKALLFVQMSAVLAQRLQSKVITQTLLRSNFVAVLILQVLSPTVDELYHQARPALPKKPAEDSGNSEIPEKFSEKRAKQRRLLKVGLMLLLAVVQSKEGAEDVFASALLPLFVKSVSAFEDDMLLLALQIMISMLMSVGKENHLAAERIRNVLDAHQRTIQDVLHRDASLNRALQNQHAESELSLLAREVTILVTLTGTQLRPV